MQVLRLPRSQRRGILAGAAARSAGLGDEAATPTTRRRAEDDEEEKSIYGAAYEDVTYKDSTDDDVEGEVSRLSAATGLRPATRKPSASRNGCKFPSTLARLWNIATRLVRHGRRRRAAARPGGPARLARQGPRPFPGACSKLLDTLHEHEIPKPSGSYDSLVEFDHRRADQGTPARRRHHHLPGPGAVASAPCAALAPSDIRAGQGRPRLGAAHPAPGTGPAAAAAATRRARLLPEFIEQFRTEPLLYRPLHHGGHPRPILRASIAQTILRGLVANLPRQGLLRETLQPPAARPHDGGQARPARPARHRVRPPLPGRPQAVVEAVVDAAQRDSADPEPLGGDARNHRRAVHRGLGRALQDAARLDARRHHQRQGLGPAASTSSKTTATTCSPPSS